MIRIMPAYRDGPAAIKAKDVGNPRSTIAEVLDEEESTKSGVSWCGGTARLPAQPRISPHMSLVGF